MSDNNNSNKGSIISASLEAELLPVIFLLGIACAVSIQIRFARLIGWDHTPHELDVLTTKLPIDDLKFGILLLLQQAGFWIALLSLARFDKKALINKEFEEWFLPAALLLVFTGTIVSALIPPINSIDLYYYAMYGRVVDVFGASPYLEPLSKYAQDGLVSSIPSYWLENRCFYGPLAVTFFSLLNALPHSSLLDLLFIFKMSWLLLFWITAFAGYRVFISRRAHPSTARVLLFGLFGNPAMWWHLLTDAHLELLMLLPLGGVIAALGEKKWKRAGLFLGMAVAIKIVCLVVVPFVALWIYSQDSAEKKTLRSAIEFLWTFFLFLVPLYGVYQGAEVASLFGFTIATYWRTFSLVPNSIEILLRAVTSFAGGYDEEELATASVHLSNVLFVIGALSAWVTLWFRRRLFRNCNTALLIALPLCWVVLTRPYYQPWYLWWFVPFLLLSTAFQTFRSRLLFLFWFSCFVTFSYRDHAAQGTDVMTVGVIICGIVFLIRSLFQSVRSTHPSLL